MHTTAQELSSLCDRRKFATVTRKYEAGEVDERDPDGLYQAYLAYSMLGKRDTAATIAGLLPKSMQHDAERDTILMELRLGDGDLHALARRAEALVNETPDDRDRNATARMTLARSYRAHGRNEEASAQIGLAMMRIIATNERPEWRGNIALWYLAIGEYQGMRTRALYWALRDSSPIRQLAAVLCYITPSLGRRLLPN